MSNILSKMRGGVLDKEPLWPKKEFMKKVISRWVIAGALVVGANAQVPQAYEIPPVLSSARILPADMMRGPHHRVRDPAPSDGYMTHFTIDSDFKIYRKRDRRVVPLLYPGE